MNNSLYALLLGDSFDALDPLLRALHDGRGRKRYVGRCVVQGGSTWSARLLSRIARLPRTEADAPIAVHIEVNHDGETWTRRFGEHTMRSAVRARASLLEEQLGPLTFAFQLSASTDRIVWTLRSVRLLFAPLPRALFSECTAVESSSAGRYHFDVRAQIKGIGLIVHYRGWLAEHEAEHPGL